MDLGTEINLKIKEAVKVKLSELGCYMDEELLDYVMVMVANKKSASSMAHKLSIFLSDKAEVFSNWLHELLQRLSTKPKKEDKKIVKSKKRSTSEDTTSEKPKKRKESLRSPVIYEEKSDKEDSRAVTAVQKESSPKQKSAVYSSRHDKYEISRREKEDSIHHPKEEKSRMSAHSRLGNKRSAIPSKRRRGRDSSSDRSPSPLHSTKSRTSVLAEVISHEETLTDKEILRSKGVPSSVKVERQWTLSSHQQASSSLISKAINDVANSSDRVARKKSKPTQSNTVENKEENPSSKADVENNREIVNQRTVLEDDTTAVHDPKFFVSLNGASEHLRNIENALEPISGDDDAESSNLNPDANEKISERCKYWPLCKSGEKCPYVHPSQLCKLFPNCKFNKACLYIHPFCKFDAQCANPNCAYSHTSINRKPAPPKVQTTFMPEYVAPVIPKCRYGSKCVSKKCAFAHPKVSKLCAFGVACNRPNCMFLHNNSSKYKYIKPLSIDFEEPVSVKD